MCRAEGKAERAATAVSIVVALAIAWYIGFRPPSAWTATLDAVSVTDGFHRRFLVGTLLRPIAEATDYNYWVFASFSFAVLAALIAILVVQGLRAKPMVHRLMIVAFFLLPTGGFLFHVVGYFEQTLYLMLFVAMWLLARGRIIAATAVMALAPLVHEIAVLSVLPVFGIVALRRVSPKQAIAITAIPLVVNLVVLLLPVSDESAVTTLATSLGRANFAYRHDALALFTRTQHESWRLYNIHEVTILVRPIAYFFVGAFGVLWWANRGNWRVIAKVPGPLVFIACACAIALPGLLVYGGFDANRWLMLVLCNFFIIVWIMIDDTRPPRRSAQVVLAAAFLAMAHVQLTFFPPERPRPLQYRDVVFMLREIRTGVFFEPPGI